MTRKWCALRLVELFQDFAVAGKLVYAGYEAAAALNACAYDFSNFIKH
jgi:hypothetical protein